MSNFLKQFALARAQVERLRELYPWCFDSSGRAIVAVAAFPARKVGITGAAK